MYDEENSVRLASVAEVTTGEDEQGARFTVTTESSELSVSSSLDDEVLVTLVMLAPTSDVDDADSWRDLNT